MPVGPLVRRARGLLRPAGMRTLLLMLGATVLLITTHALTQPDRHPPHGKSLPRDEQAVPAPLLANANPAASRRGPDSVPAPPRSTAADNHAGDGNGPHDAGVIKPQVSPLEGSGGSTSSICANSGAGAPSSGSNSRPTGQQRSVKGLVVSLAGSAVGGALTQPLAPAAAWWSACAGVLAALVVWHVW